MGREELAFGSLSLGEIIIKTTKYSWDRSKAKQLSPTQMKEGGGLELDDLLIAKN